MNLDGKSAVVTGAGGGIGRAIALGMACAGARVAVADIDSQAAAETVSMLDASASSESIAITADLGDVEQIDQMVATAVQRFGRLDVMVNNAGVTRRAYVMDLTEEDFDRINRVNFKGVFFGLQRAAREMIPRREGVIVNIASIAGRGLGGASNVIYAGTKGAVIALTRLSPRGSSRNTISTSMPSAPVTPTPRWRGPIWPSALSRRASPWKRRARKGCEKFRFDASTSLPTSPTPWCSLHRQRHAISPDSR